MSRGKPDGTRERYSAGSVQQFKNATHGYARQPNDCARSTLGYLTEIRDCQPPTG
jgi:hypothetical protein